MNSTAKIVMSKPRLEGMVLTPKGFIDGYIEMDSTAAGGRIAEISGSPIDESKVRQSGRPIIVPGFIDLHVHGGGGHDVMEGGDAASLVAALHARFGTTSMLATTMTAPAADLDVAFSGMRQFFSAGVRQQSAARILGIHLEGPYINPGKLGAQPNFSRALDRQELRRLNAMAPIRVVTLAPEIGQNLNEIESLTAMGIRVQIGHTLGTYEDGQAALAKGATGFTHLFNAMTALHHRSPGMVGAALAHAEYSEVIPDLLHVHPGAIRVALRSIPKLFCVTDSTAASGMPDGEYRLGRHTVTKCLGGVRLADGTLAGSTLTMDQAFRNLVNVLGLSISEASARVSNHAADFLGLTDRGSLVEGAWGDWVILDGNLQVQDVYVEGLSISAKSGIRKLERNESNQTPVC